MIDKPLSAITAADLQRLIDDEVGERKNLDYKRDLPGNSRGDRIEFLADISSFANTDGGDLIFGIDAPSGAFGCHTREQPRSAVRDLRGS